MATLADALADPIRGVGKKKATARKSGVKPTPRRTKSGTKKSGTKKGGTKKPRKPRRTSTASCSTTKGTKRCYKKRAAKPCKARVTRIRTYKTKSGQKRVSLGVIVT